MRSERVAVSGVVVRSPGSADGSRRDRRLGVGKSNPENRSISALYVSGPDLAVPLSRGVASATC